MKVFINVRLISQQFYPSKSKLITNGITENIRNCYEQKSKNIQMGFHHFHPADDSTRHPHGHEYHRPLEQEKISTKSVLIRGWGLGFRG